MISTIIILYSSFNAGLATRSASDIGKAGAASKGILDMMEYPSVYEVLDSKATWNMKSDYFIEFRNVWF